jgi:uncharacterized tellurite resistance protein B-like protein
MFARIFSAFAAPEPQALPEPDEKLALGALMVRVAKSDDSYKLSEISRIDRVLGRMNQLNPVEAAKMRATCEKLEKEAPETSEFASLIRKTTSFDSRVDALEALWEVVLADGERHEAELLVVKEVREALGLSDIDDERAQLWAEEQ